MPTYEYRCNACQREFEYQQKMDDPDLVTCEACGAAKLERLISWTSVRSDTWRAALKADNPKEAFRGIHAVDRSTVQRFKGNDAAATEAEAPAAAPPSSEAAEPPAPSDDDSSKT
jgi:putative FmdB family regulatory protein